MRIILFMTTIPLRVGKVAVEATVDVHPFVALWEQANRVFINVPHLLYRLSAIR
jgi:hypothetical protein